MKTELAAVLIALMPAAARSAQPVDSFAALRQLFPSPPAEYSTAPFLVWDGEVTEADVDKHLADFHAQGIRAFFVHPRPGMITPYLSDRWFDLWKYTLAKAKQLGMQAWIYDENSYPSGFAGGHVPAEMPESYNQGQGLTLYNLPQLAPDAARRFKVVLKKNGDAFEDVTTTLEKEQGHTGEYYAFELAYYDKRAWHGGWSYVDLLKPGVTGKFIEVTMRGYERAIGPEFGRAVPGIFTDEPNIVPPGRRNTLRWTPDLFEQFRTRWGYDLRPKLPALYEQTGDWRKVRHDYYSLLLDLFIDRWSKPWHAYTTAHNLEWTGHYWEHGWPSPNDGPDNMAMYAWHHVPGIDMLFNQYKEEVNAQFGNIRSVRELASVASQMGRRRTLSETYGGAGWELRFEDMKRLGDWEYALGVNLMNQHLAFQTLAGVRKYDYPQSFTYHEPWWKHYHVLANYFARLSAALSTGEQVNRIVVIEPTTSAWMYAQYGAADPRMMDLGRAFQNFLNAIEARQVEYDLASERILRDVGRTEGPRLVAGRRAYDLVVLPPGLESLDSRTVDLLADYLKSGGKVLSLVDPALRVDGAESPRAAALAAQYPEAWTHASGPEALSNPAFITVEGKLFHQRRVLSDGELLFFVNTNLDRPARAAVRIAAASAARLDPFTGRIEQYPVANSQVAVDLPPAGSLLLYTGAAAAGPATAGARSHAGGRPVAPAGPVEVKRLSPNVIQIDYCDLKLADREDHGLYFYNAGDKVWKHYGFAEGNPWNTAVQYKTAILDRNHFDPDSGFEAAFSFEIAPGADTRGMQAVVEQPQYWHVAVNGTPIEARKGEWWLDTRFGVYDISALVVPGLNRITVAARPMSVYNELEPVYVLGNFGVAAQDQGWKLVPATTLAPGAWKERSLPFYSDRVAYARTFDLKRGAPYVVRLGKWQGTVAEVLVNGKSAGIIGWQPYEADISGLVSGGRNRIEVVVYGSLKNLLGPHHGRITPGLVTPWAFRNAPQQQSAGAAYDLASYGLFEDFVVVQR